MFQKTVTSCKIYLNGILSEIVLSSSLSGTSFNVEFDPAKSTNSDNYELICTLSNGLTVTNNFRIEIT